MKNLFVVVAAIPLFVSVVWAGASGEEVKTEAQAKHYVCPSCGSPCDNLVFDKPGTCPSCGMTLVEQGAVAEAARAWSQPLSQTARKVLGLEELATLPLAEAIEAVVAATRRLARYQRKWIRRLPGVVTLDGNRPPEELADEIVALAGAGQRLPRR